MRSTILGRSSMSCVRALLVLVAWAAVDQGRVLADCRSHDLPTISLASGSGDGFTSLDLAGRQAQADLAEIPGRSKPCTGPTCSGRTDLPLAPATPELDRIGSWAILQAPLAVLIRKSFESRLNEPGVRATHGSASIFHPPRPFPSQLTS